MKLWDLRRVWTGVIAAAALLGLAACGPAEDAGTAEPGASVLHRGNGAEPGSLDPHRSVGSWENRIIGDMLLGLMTEGPDSEPMYGAAEAYTVSDDGLTYRFAMREGHLWSDGEPVTADDFVFSFRRILDPATAAEYAFILYDIKNAEAVNTGAMPVDALGVRAEDPRTLVLELGHPAPYLIEMLMHTSFLPVPAHKVAELGDAWIKPENFVGNGAYRLVEWRPQDRVRLVRNENFYDTDAVAIDEVIYYPTTDVNAALRRFRAGELDINFGWPVNQGTTLREQMPDNALLATGLVTNYVSFNLTKPPFDDVRVREALSLSIDRDAVTQKVLQGFSGISAYAFVPPGMANYPEPPQPDFAALSQEERNARARSLLAEAGYGPDNPLRFAYSFRASGEDARRVAASYKNMWDGLGAEVELVGTEAKVHYDNMRSGNFEVGDAGWYADFNDPKNYLFLLLSGNQLNYPRYQNPDYDALLAAADEEADPSARAALLVQAEAMLLSDLPITATYNPQTRWLVSDRVQGWLPNVRNTHRTRFLRLESE